MIDVRKYHALIAASRTSEVARMALKDFMEENGVGAEEHRNVLEEMNYPEARRQLTSYYDQE